MPSCPFDSPAHRRGGIFLPAALALATSILLGSFAQASLFSPSSGPSHAGVPRSALANLNVAVLRSGYTSAFFVDKLLYEEAVTKWLTFFAEEGIRHRLINDSELEEGSLEDFAVLVLPTAICLSDEQRISIKRFLTAGKGVIATWAPGVRSKDGEWVGWAFMEELTHRSFVGYLEARPVAWVTLSGSSPLSAGLQPGLRIGLVAGWKTPLSGNPADTYFSNHNLTPMAVAHEPSVCAISRSEFEGGRLVWFGFSLPSVIPRQKEQAILRRLLMNALVWTGRIPMCQALPWPDARKAAMVVSQDVEHRFENGENALEILKEEGVRGTFFCVSDLGKNNKELVKAFAETGEVGTHSDNHEQFAGQPFEVQHRRLRDSAADLEKLGVSKVKGFRPPYELCDGATLKAWAMLGGEFIFGQPEYDPRMTPELVTVVDSTSQDTAVHRQLVLLPRIGRDDHGTMVLEGLTDNAQILERHKADLDWVYGLGGLFMFGYHSNLLSLPERAEVLRELIRYAKTLDIWLATAGDVATWWKAAANISAQIEEGPEGVLSLSVRNDGPDPLSGVTLLVHLPQTPDTAKVESASALPVRHDLEGSELRIHVDTLNPDTVETYNVTVW